MWKQRALSYCGACFDLWSLPVHQPGCDGTKLLALKFVESVVLLYTPDPNGSLEPPPQYFEGVKLRGNLMLSSSYDFSSIFLRVLNFPTSGNSMEFNVSWLRGGHPVLSVGDLSNEASKSLGLLLDQLRFPTVKSLSSLTIIVLVNRYTSIKLSDYSFLQGLF